MPDQDALPRLADALLDVGTRLNQISAELRTLRVATPEPAPAPPPLATATADQATLRATVSQAEPASRQAEPAANHAEAHSAAAIRTEPAAGQAEPHLATSQAAPAATSQTNLTPASQTDPAADASRAEPPATNQVEPHLATSPAEPAAASQAETLGEPAGASRAEPSAGQFQPNQQVPWYPPPQPLPAHPPTPRLWEKLSQDGAGSRLLAWAGGVITLAGVVLLLVLAIQRGWLGPGPRVLLGVGLGLALAGIGMWLHRNPTARTGAYAVGATGVAVLFLDVVAATSLYGFLPVWGGLLAGLAVTAAGVALAGRWQSQLFAVFVVVCCAASAPVLTGGFDALLLGFLLVLLLGATPVQLTMRWGGLALAAGLPPVVVSVINIVSIAGDQLHDDPALTAILCGTTSAVLILLATVTTLRRPTDDYAFATLFLAPAPGMLAAVLLPRLGAAVLPAAIALLLATVWAVGRFGDLPSALAPRFSLAAGGLASLALLQATATAFDGDARAIALLGEALVIAVLATRIRLRAALVPAGAFAVIGLVLALVTAVNPALVVAPPRFWWSVGDSVGLGLTGLVLAATAITLCWAVFRLGVLPDGERAPHGWVPAGVVALYGSTATLLSIGLLLSPDRAGFLVGHVLVTVAWTVGAFVLLLRGVDAVPLRVAGLSLVAASLAKLVLFDLSSLDGMARVAAFLVAGLVLLGAGARYARLVAARTRS